MANEKNLKKWPKGKSGNMKGRPKKWVLSLKRKGYAFSQIVDTLSILIIMTEKELCDIAVDKDRPMLESTVAAAIIEGRKKKTLHHLELILTRAYGRPIQQLQHTGKDGEKLFPDWLSKSPKDSTV